MEDHTHAHHDTAHEPTPVSTPAPVAAVEAKKDYTALYIPGAIVIAGIIIAGALIVAFKGQSTAAPAANGQQPTAKVDVKDIPVTENNPYIGDKNAPVTLIAWEDYQCPYCIIGHRCGWNYQSNHSQGEHHSNR